MFSIQKKYTGNNRLFESFFTFFVVKKNADVEIRKNYGVKHPMKPLISLTTWKRNINQLI